MGQEFEGDLVESVFWGAELQRSVFRDVDLTGSRITHSLVVDVEIDAMVERLVVNGVDVTSFVNQHDPWFPLRTMLRPADPDAMRATWVAVEAAWSETVAIARAVPEPLLHERVDGEFSFVETVRHLLFGMDKWFSSPILGLPFHPYGVPNTGSLEFPWPGLDLAARPSLDDALAARDERAARFAERVEAMERIEDSDIEVLENGTVPWRAAFDVVFEEQFWHLRYARRDLSTLTERHAGS